MRKLLTVIALTLCLAIQAMEALPTRVLVIMAEFSDAKFADGNDKTAYSDFFNGTNYTYNGATGSVQRYFNDQSYGKFVPQFDVVGPFSLPGLRADYGRNDADGDDQAAEQMVLDACQAAHSNGVNFAEYDVNGDGYTEAIIIVYAGQGETEKLPDLVYPQMGYAESDLVLDKKIIGAYAYVPELNEKNKRAGIGEVVYQFSHILGLPTLSDTEGGTEKTLGDWDVMDHGCYNNEGNTPASYSAYERFYLGWVEPVLLNEPMNVRLEDLNKAGVCGIVTRSGQTNLLGNSPDPREFFILENRQQSGWDKYIPGHGLLLTKIDYVRSRWAGDEVNVMIKGNPSLLVDIIEADGKAPQYKADNLTNGYFGKSGDAFPAGASSKTLFSNKWSLDNIAEKNGTIQFLFNGGVEKGCTVTFYVGDNGTAANSKATESAPFAGVILSDVTPKSGFTFLGWSSRKNSTIPDAGQPGETFYPMSDCAVYAIMQDNTRFWFYYDMKGVVIDDYIGFNGAYVKVNDIKDAAIRFIKKEGYESPTADNCYVRVECNGKQLNNIATYDKDTVLITIPKTDISGDVYVTVRNTRFQNENGCADYEHTFTQACGIGTNDLSGYDWVVSMNNVEAEATFEKGKGAKFGSGTKPSNGVSFYTEETAGCGVKKIEVEASMASNGDAMLDVYMAGDFIGNSEELSETNTIYTYELEKPQSGNVKIVFTNSSKAIYVKRIAIYYEYLDSDTTDDSQSDEPETPGDVTSDPEEAVENIQTMVDGQKTLIDGHLYIRSNGVVYNILGTKITK